MLHGLQTAVRFVPGVRDFNGYPEPLICNAAPALPLVVFCICRSRQLHLRIDRASEPSRPDLQLLSHSCICPRAQLQLIYLSLKLRNLNCICQMAFSPCRSPVALSDLILTLGACVDWEVWRVNGRFTCKPVFPGSRALFPGGNWVWCGCQRLSQQPVPDLQVVFLCPVAKHKVIQDSLTPQWGRRASTGTQPTDRELKSSCKDAERPQLYSACENFIT